MYPLFCWTARKIVNGKVVESRYFDSKEERDCFVKEHHEWCKRGKICKENLRKHIQVERGSDD